MAIGCMAVLVFALFFNNVEFIFKLGHGCAVLAVLYGCAVVLCCMAIGCVAVAIALAGGSGRSYGWWLWPGPPTSHHAPHPATPLNLRLINW